MRCLGLLALGAAVVMAASPATAAGRRAAVPPPAVRVIYPTPARLVALWEQQSTVGAEIVALRRVFPAEVMRIAETALDKAKAGASNAEVSAYVFKARQDLMRDNLWFAGLAPDDRLKAYIDNQALTLAALEKTDLDSCAATVSGGKRYGAKAGGLIAANVALIGLMEAGRATPVRHEAATAEDVSAMVTALRGHDVSEAEAGALLTDSLGELPAARLCHLGVALAQAMQEIPAASAIRITAQGMTPQEKRPPGQTPEQRIAARWTQDPILGAVMPELIAQMPDDMNLIIRSMADRARAGDAAGESQAFTDGFKRLIASQMEAMDAAPAEALTAAGRALADYLQTLQTVDPHCGLDQPAAPIASTDLDTADKRVTRRLAELLLAGRAAQAHGQISLQRTPTPADTKLLLDRLHYLTGGGAIYEALAKGRTRDLPVADRCQANRLMVQAMLLTTQPAQSDLLAAYIRDVYAPAAAMAQAQSVR